MGRTARNGQGPPRRIAGRYRLLEKLGTGGMSEVWRGYDETLGRPVAVKVLSPRHADDQTFRDRLRQEALAAARLSHPHITGIFDFGESPLDERLTVPYVVMELNDGESVAARLARAGPLTWKDAVTVGAEVASALATAHARGVVHRDVTPANVMLTGAGAKVVDFGISAIVGQRDAALDGSLLGTPAYLAPERLGGSPVSAATDVYALGLLLYRALTGRLPWPAETTSEALRAHLYAEPEPVPARPGLPDAVRDLCLRCLAKQPGDRPAAAEVARVLGAEVGMQPIIPPLTAREAGSTVSGAAAVPPFEAVPVGLGRSVLAYLGLPYLARPDFGRPDFGRPYFGRPGGAASGPRPSAGVLRLRAGLRIGSMLRVGGVRPLGGGLFAGGGLGARVRPGRSAPAGGLPGRRSHRVQAAMVTMALLGAAGVSWSASHDSPAAEQTQAAGAGAAVAAPSGNSCAVRYLLKRDSGTDYEALLTVATNDDVARELWRVQFLYPGSQRLTGIPKAITQSGRKVVAKGRGKLQTFTLRGDYRGYNPLPLAFSVNGHRCRGEVVGGITAEPITEAADEKQAGEARRHRPPRKSSTPQKRAGHPETAQPKTAQTTTPPPVARKTEGFSLAL